jgi:hypothetical protein
VNRPSTLLSENDYDAIRDGKVVIYAAMERDGFVTWARTDIDKDDFLHKGHTQKTGTIIVDELQKCLLP